jgi:hypothetical protein
MESSSLDLNKAATFWKKGERKYWAFLCPFCQVSRRIPFRPRPGSARHIVQILLSTAFLALLSWKWLGWKGVVFFFPLWSIFEVFYRWRVRGVLACSVCGFDPYLYLIDEKWARREIESHWKKKFAERGIPYPVSHPEKST